MIFAASPSRPNRVDIMLQWVYYLSAAVGAASAMFLREGLSTSGRLSLFSSLSAKDDGLRILATRYRGRGIGITRYNVWMACLWTSARRLYWKQRIATMPTKLPVVHADPEIPAARPCLSGLGCPCESLFDYLEGGDTLDEFLRQFPSVQRQQAIAALELARESVLTSARPA